MDPKPQTSRSAVCDHEGDHAVHIIELNPRKLLFLCDFLSVPGLRVTGSSDPERGLDYIARAQPDVVICDLALPQMEGEELLDRIRKVSPRTRVILTSGRSSLPIVEHMRAGGGIDLLLGPLSAPGLLNAVQRMLPKAG